MLEDILDKVDKRKKRRGDTFGLQAPCKTAELAILKRTVKDEYNYVLPEGYLDFLTRTDGFVFNGIYIYASREQPITGYDDRFLEGFMDANKAFREEPGHADFIFFGNASVENFVYNLKMAKFQIISRTSLEPFDSFDNFDQLLIAALTIYD